MEAGFLGHSGAPGAPGASWGLLGASWGFLGLPGGIWGCWGLLEPPLGACWVLGSSWGFLGFPGASPRVLVEFPCVSCGILGLFGRCGSCLCSVGVVSGGCLHPVVVLLGGACVQSWPGRALVSGRLLDGVPGWVSPLRQ